MLETAYTPHSTLACKCNAKTASHKPHFMRAMSGEAGRCQITMKKKASTTLFYSAARETNKTKQRFYYIPPDRERRRLKSFVQT